MHCFACDVILTPQEATRRFKESGTFVDLCNKCLSTIEKEVETKEGKYEQEEENYED